MTRKAEEIEYRKMVKLAKSFADLPKDWKQTLWDKAQEALSTAGMYTAIGLNRYYHKLVYAESEEYRDWFELCKDLCLETWIGIGRKLIFDRNANGAAYSLIMRNMFGWEKPSQVRGDALPDTPAETEQDEDISKYKRKAKGEQPELHQ